MKICPSCGSSVRDAAAECPSCEFDFEEGSSATMRGVAPVDSDKSDGEPEETAEEPGEGEREPRETAFGMPTADSRPGRVPDVTDDGDSASESHSGDSGADGSSPQADEQGDGATTSIPRDELQGILGSPDSEQDDPGGATKSIERDSLDQLVGDLDDSAESTSSDTATGQNKSLSRGDESPTSAPNPNESAIPTMHRGDEDDSTEEPGARETAEQSGGEEDTSSTRFGMPAVDRDTADGDDGGASEQGTRGPAPGLSPSSSVVDSDDETTSGEPAGNERETAEADASPLGPASGQSPSIDDGEAGDSPTKTLMGMSAAPKEGASGEKSRSSSETSTDPDDMTGPERETAEQEAEPFNIKGFQETGDSQAAEIGTRDSDPIDPPEIEDTGADDSQADESESAAPASEGREEQSEEELWSATIEQDDPGGPDALEDGGDAHQRETSPPSAASLFDESDPEEGSPRDGDFAFEHGPSDDEGSTDESGGSATPAAKASGIVRPKNRASSDRESTDDIAENQPDEQSESGLIGGGTYMVRGDGGGLEDDSDLEEVDPGGIDWEEFENAGLAGGEGDDGADEPQPQQTTTEQEVPSAQDLRESDSEQKGASEPSPESDAEIPESRPGSPVPPESDRRTDGQASDTAPESESRQQATQQQTDTSSEPGSAQSRSVQEEGRTASEVSRENAPGTTARAARPREKKRQPESEQKTPPPTAETSRNAEARPAAQPANQQKLDRKLVEIGQSMFGTVAGVLLIGFAALRLITAGPSPLDVTTLVCGIGGLSVVAAPFVPIGLQFRSAILWAVGLAVLVVVPLYGIDTSFESQHVLGVLGGALTLVAGLFPTVVRLLESVAGTSGGDS